jgi:hypothetical protein
METDSDSKIVYKYTSANSARLIIANRSLRVGRPTEINDPFDVYIEDLFEAGLQNIYERAAADLVDVLTRDPGTFAERIGVPIELAMAESARINRSSESDRRALLEAARAFASHQSRLGSRAKGA